MKIFSKDFFLLPIDKDITINSIRKKLLSWMLILTNILAAPILIIAIIEAVKLEQTYIAFLYPVFYLPVLFALVFQKKIPYSYTVLMVLFSTYALGVINVVVYGFSGAGLPLFYYLAILSTIFLGLRAGFITIISCSIPMIIIAFLMTQGILTIDIDLMEISKSSISWITAIIIMIFLASIMISGYGIIQHNLLYALKIVRNQNNNLNITKNKQAENIIYLQKVKKELESAKEKAEESEKLYRNTFNKAPVGIAHVSPDGGFLKVNESFCEIIGYTQAELSNLKFSDITHPDDLKIEIPFIEKVLRNEIDTFNIEKRYIHKKGHIVWINLQSSIIKDNNNNVLYAIASISDITNKINLQNEIIKAKEKAEQNSRLKTAFLNNLSHEIRTPLNAICGFSSMLDYPNLNKDKRKNFVSRIQSSSDQLLTIVSDIITMSSLETNLESVDIEAVNINEIMNELLAEFKQQTTNRDISLYSKQELTDRQSVVYTDKTKLTQILSNLISNALKFTHEGFIEFGYALVQSGHDPSQHEMQFFVKDSGIGIRQDLHDKIFEQFRQADETIQQTYGGTGLGLSISKGFAELLGGEIWLDSEVGKGSAFYFTIPYKPANETDDKKPTIEPKKNTGHATILIAEDEEFNYMYLEELLIDFDYTIIHAKNGQEALEIFKTNHDISLILMDIKMPIMTGHEAAKIIKEQKPDLPIIAQSAYALEHERAKYEGIFDDYLTKPIKEETLIEKVSKYVDSK